jgi:hypothetical protein
MVVVALGEPGVPVISWVWTIGTSATLKTSVRRVILFILISDLRSLDRFSNRHS